MSKYAEILKMITHNERELNRYIKFIENCMNHNLESEENIKEQLIAHHICPRAEDMFPHYESFEEYSWNKAMLTERQHYLAHMMLWKVYRNKSMTYAFNMMSNFQQIYYSSKLYEKHRKDFRKFISELNSRSRTDEEKQNLSNMMKNSIVVYDIRDPEKKRFRIWKDSNEYDKDNHIYYRTGYKHTEETKKKMRRKGGKYCHNTKDGTVKIIYDDNLPKEFEWGYPKGVLTAEHVKGTVWFHNPETGEHIRTKEGLQPKGFLKGRLLLENPGIEKANSMINVVDLVDRKVDKVLILDKKRHAPESGTSTENTNVFIFEDKIFTSKRKLIDFLKSIDYHLNIYRGVSLPDDIENIKVKKPHFNCSDSVNRFRKKFQGVSYKDLGLKVVKLEMFDISQHKEKEIYWDES